MRKTLHILLLIINLLIFAGVMVFELAGPYKFGVIKASIDSISPNPVPCFGEEYYNIASIRAAHSPDLISTSNIVYLANELQSKKEAYVHYFGSRFAFEPLFLEQEEFDAVLHQINYTPVSPSNPWTWMHLLYTMAKWTSLLTAIWLTFRYFSRK